MKRSTKEGLMITGGAIIFSLQVAILGYWILGTPPKPAAKQLVSRPGDTLVPTPQAQQINAAVTVPNKRVEVSTAGHPSKGPANAPVTIVEFSDFECPFCLQDVPVLAQIESAYKGKVRRVFREFPLRQIHAHAQGAAEAALCAGEQNRFWEMHDLLFQEPRTLLPEDFSKKAESLGLNSAKFKSCMESGKEKEIINQDIAEGTKLGITGTPATFINGRMINGAKPYDAFARVIDEELANSSLAKP